MTTPVVPQEGRHTPGPWHRNIKPATKYNTVWAGRNTHVLRVVVDGLPPEQVEGNICLAAASPRLFDVCRAIEHALNAGHSAAEVLDENSPLRDELRAAIAAATPGAPT